jgi:hypothetical protein
VQLRSDLWADLLTQDAVREGLIAASQHQRELSRGWIEEAIASGELAAIRASPLASIPTALADGPMFHVALDRTDLSGPVSDW